MTVLQAVKDASGVIGIVQPTVVYGDTADTSLLIQSCMNECAQMIAYDAAHEWSWMKSLATITGDGATKIWPFPADYKHMLKRMKLWPSATPTQPLIHYTDTNDFLSMQVQAFQSILNGWTIIGTKINTLVAIAAATTVKYYYIINTPVTDTGGAPKAAFTVDTDTHPLGDRLLKLAFIYRWKQDRGQDYGEAMEDYQTALAIAIGEDKGTVILRVGRLRVRRRGNGNAFPRSLGT